MTTESVSVGAYRTLSDLIPRRQKNAIKRGIAFGRRLVPATPRLAPSFMIIGAQKAGTTSLFKYLMWHGAYLRPLLKDIYFFDRDFDRGLPWYLSFFPAHSAAEEHAARLGGPVVTGEGATHYLLHPWAPERMRSLFPEMRIVVLLRDPVRRAVSHYYHNVRMGTEPMADPLQAFEAEESRIAADARRMAEDPHFYSDDVMRYSYLGRGRYAEQLARWFACFPREQILVQFSERFYGEPDQSFREICRFIGIAERSLPAYPPEGAGGGKKPSDAALAYARDHFRPHNVALRALLGTDPGWAS